MEYKQSLNFDSKIISFLRFPLILGVIFIHNGSSIITIPGEVFGSANNPFFLFFSKMFSNILLAVSIPLFFFFSGYLLFLSIDFFTKNVYIDKIKRRIRTLLIPYLFWNISLLIIFLIISCIPSLNSFLNHKHTLSLSYLIKSLWSIGELESPINYPFWFIRNLMVIVLFYPLVFIYIKRLKYIGIILLGIIWCSGFKIPIPGFGMSTSFFFVLGAWFSINNKSFTLFVYKIKWIAYLYPIFILAEFLVNNPTANFFIHKIGILVGICFWILISKELVARYRNKFIYVLSSFSFFIFAFHEPLLTIVRKTMYVIFKPQTDFLISSFYFIIIFLVVAISLAVGYTINKYAPKFYNIITGERGLDMIIKVNSQRKE